MGGPLLQTPPLAVWNGRRSSKHLRPLECSTRDADSLLDACAGNETRIIPVGPAPHISPKIREYLGDARGRFEGGTLVVETTNFTDKTAYRGSSESLKLTERFKPVGPNTFEWSVTFDDPHTWSRPWTFTMNLTKVPDDQGPFEYACHEGNYGLRNLLSAARSEDRQVAAGLARPTAAGEDEGGSKQSEYQD